MKYSELIVKVSAETGVDQKAVKKSLDFAFQVIKNSLSLGDKEVVLKNFGKFYTKKRSPRMGYNPISKKMVEIPARTVPAFKPSMEFHECLN